MKNFFHRFEFRARKKKSSSVVELEQQPLHVAVVATCDGGQEGDEDERGNINNNNNNRKRGKRSRTLATQAATVAAVTAAASPDLDGDESIHPKQLAT